MSELIDGLKRLKLGAILNVVSVAISVILSTVILYYAYVGITNGYSFIPRNIFMLLKFTLCLILILGFASFIFYYIAANNFGKFDPRLRIGKLGVILQLVGMGIITLSVSIITFPSFLHIAYEVEMMLTGVLLILILIGGLIFNIGIIFFSVMLLKMGDMPEFSNSFAIAGALLIVAVIVRPTLYNIAEWLYGPSSFAKLVVMAINLVGGIFGLLAIVLIYLSANAALNKL